MRVERMRLARFEIRKELASKQVAKNKPKQLWYWSLVSANGHDVIAQSPIGQGYSSRDAANRAVVRLREAVATATIGGADV